MMGQAWPLCNFHPFVRETNIEQKLTKNGKSVNGVVGNRTRDLRRINCATFCNCFDHCYLGTQQVQCSSLANLTGSQVGISGFGRSIPSRMQSVPQTGMSHSSHSHWLCSRSGDPFTKQNGLPSPHGDPFVQFNRFKTHSQRSYYTHREGML